MPPMLTVESIEPSSTTEQRNTEENVRMAHAFAMAAGDALRGAESVPGDVVTRLLMVVEGLLRGPAQGEGR